MKQCLWKIGFVITTIGMMCADSESLLILMIITGVGLTAMFYGIMEV